MKRGDERDGKRQRRGINYGANGEACMGERYKLTRALTAF